MKKLLFVMTSLHIGGVSTSLINLLNELVKDNNLEIDLLLFDYELKSEFELPKNIKIISIDNYIKLIAISQSAAKKMGLRFWMYRLIIGGLTKIFGHGLSYKILFYKKKLNKLYDFAFSCTQSAPYRNLYGGCNEYVLNNVSAKIKCSFLHCDYCSYGINDKYSKNIYNRFDKIITVSESVKKIFLTVEPKLIDRTVVICNCQNVDKIIMQAEKEPIYYDKKFLNFITVSRISKEKGHLRMLSIFSKLKKDGFLFKWNIIGDFNNELGTLFKEKIIENNLQNEIILHGNQINPYRFMKYSDVLLIPSYHEAAPMVIGEATILNIPIISTNTISANEMIKDCKIGYVCPNDNKEIYFSIKYILENQSILKQYKENMKLINSTNESPLRNFYKIIN